MMTPSLFTGLFFFSTYLMLISPFVWGIRMLIASKEKKEILREDYDRRAWIDASIRRLFPITNNNDEIESQRRKI